MITPLFSCSQPLMYQTARTMWINCKEFIIQMGGFKSFYTVDYCDARIAEIDAAEAMKSEAARALQHESVRFDLVTLADDVRGNWQALKQYISSVYKEKELREMNWRAAGWSSYDRASDDNWTSVQSLISEGKKYIEENLDTLTENNNMPVTFPATFIAAGSAFNSKLVDFGQAQETAGVETDAKNNANNDVYSKAIDMGQDGQFVMRKDESKRKQFSFEAVSEMLEPKGSSTLVVELRDTETNAVIKTFEVTNLETQRTVTSIEGRAEMGLQAAGENKQYRIVADGYPEETISVNMNTGTKVVKKLTVAPLISAAAKAELEEIENATPTPSPELVTVR